MDIDWMKTAHIYMQSGSYLLQATLPVTFEANVSRQGQSRHNDVETTATRNIIAEVICLMCFRLTNVISTESFNNMLKVL